jgi:hypothetical protein
MGEKRKTDLSPDKKEMMDLGDARRISGKEEIRGEKIFE